MYFIWGDNFSLYCLDILVHYEPIKHNHTGDSDELVPASHMRTLYNLAEKCTQREFYSVVRGTHNDTFEVAGAEYYRRLRAFMRQFTKHREEATGTMSRADNQSCMQQEHGETEQVEEEEDEDDERKTVHPAAMRQSGSSGSVDEEGYLMVDKEPSVSLPTMTTNFQVK